MATCLTNGRDKFQGMWLDGAVWWWQEMCQEFDLRWGAYNTTDGFIGRQGTLPSARCPQLFMNLALILVSSTTRRRYSAMDFGMSSRCSNETFYVFGNFCSRWSSCFGDQHNRRQQMRASRNSFNISSVHTKQLSNLNRQQGTCRKCQTAPSKQNNRVWQYHQIRRTSPSPSKYNRCDIPHATGAEAYIFINKPNYCLLYTSDAADD